MTATYQVDYDTMVNRTEETHAISSMAHTIYANRRATNRAMVPWRNASKVVKREYIREAKQVLGLM